MSASREETFEVPAGSLAAKVKGPASYFPSIEKTYGKPIAYWMAQLVDIRDAKHIEQVAFLKAQGIPYHFMSYVNYWTTEPHVSRNGDFGVLGNRDLEPLVNAIDFDRWIFSDDQKNGLYEMAIANNDFQEDGFHPGDATQEEWAKLISSKL